MESTKISIVNVQLNNYKPFEKMILIENENGKLFIDRELFVIRTTPNQECDFKIEPII